MIKKKKCQRCNERIKQNYSFCPTCGLQLKEIKEKYGMLGKNDSAQNIIPTMMGGISGGMLNKMLGGAMKMLENELSKEMKSNSIQPKTKLKLMINGKEIIPNGEIPKEKKSNTQILPIEFSKENLEKWKTLKKTTPTSTLKRDGNKIQYEIKIPKVKSIKDISIIKLENSLEIRAIGEKVAYRKAIQVNLPLKKYSLLKGLLTLEMSAE